MITRREGRWILFVVGCLVVAACSWPGGMLVGGGMLVYAARM